MGVVRRFLIPKLERALKYNGKWVRVIGTLSKPSEGEFFQKWGGFELELESIEIVTSKAFKKEKIDKVKVTDKLLQDFNTAYSKFDNTYTKSNETLVDFEVMTTSIRNIVDYCFSSNVKGDEFSLLVKVVNITKSTDKTGSVPMLISKELLKRVCNDKVNIKQKQDALCFLIVYQVMEDKLDIGLIPILNNFYSAHLYNARAREEIKKKLLKNNLKHPTYLFLLDAANMYNDKDVIKYLQKESSKCTQWGRDSKWFSLLLLARHGDTKAVEKVVQIAQSSLKLPKRKDQVFYMPFQLSVIPDEKIVEVLKSFLTSKEVYRLSIADVANLSVYSAIALNTMLIDFPPVSKNFASTKQVKLDQVKSYNYWLNNNKPYRYRPITKFPKEIKMKIWR